MYGRHVHMLVWFAHRPRESGVQCPTPADRQADCNEEYDAFHPFAVIAATWGTASPYVNCMAQHGVENFLAMNQAIVEPQIGFPASFYQNYPGLVWSYVPTTEQYAAWEADWLCQKVIHPSGGSAIGTVTNAGENDFMGQTRRFGFIRANDPNQPTLNHFGQLVEYDVEHCPGGGANIVDEEQIPVAGFDVETPPTEDSSTSNTAYAQQAMLKMKSDRVTTILWGGGSDFETTRDADQINYYPEWFIAGDRHLEGNTNASVEDAKEWMHATAVTTVERFPDSYDQQCFLAYTDADPNAQGPTSNAAGIACAYYPDFRLIWTGIEIAGPRLTTSNVDQGFHNIPKVSLNTPYVPTCYFDPGDYTCIKDMTYEWYDSTGTTPDNSKGCWRMVRQGERYLQGQFPPGDIYQPGNPETRPDDPCNDYGGG
jgi:hypothetical protein